jgi:hypothetical protein
MVAELSPAMRGALAYLAADEDGERAAERLSAEGYGLPTQRALLERGFAKADIATTGPDYLDTNLVRVVRLTPEGRAEADRQAASTWTEGDRS